MIPLTIWVISFFYPPDYGGASRRASNFVKMLLEKNNRVVVISSFPQYPYGRIEDPRYRGKLCHIEREGRLTVVRFRALHLPHSGIARRLLIFVAFFLLVHLVFFLVVNRKILAPEIILSSTPNIFASLAGRTLSSIFRVPHIADVVDIWPDAMVIMKSKLNHMMTAIATVLAKIAYEKPDYVITYGQIALQILRSKYRVNPSSSDYIYSGVDLDIYYPCPKVYALSKLGLDHLEQKFVVLYSGIINEFYDFEIVLDSASLLRRNSRIFFIIAGEGESKGALACKIKERQLENVLLLDRLPQEMVIHRINCADVCLIPLKEDEEMMSGDIYKSEISTKFFEYAACAKPIICTSQGEQSNLINSFQAGLGLGKSDAHKLADVLDNLSLSPELCRNMSIASRKLAEDYFALTPVGCKLERILEVIGKRRGQHSIE